ncbi:MAG: S8 family serine peptidase [Myxococcales bacterium]|nr:MAG: S8 family serine peptidase [Myxococcales bacterium]
MKNLLVLCMFLFTSQHALADDASVQYSPLVNEMSKLSYPKADTLLKQLIAQYHLNQVAHEANPSIATAMPEMKFVKMQDGKVLVDISIIGNSKEVFESLVSLGLERASHYKNMVSGYIAMDKVEALMNHPGVKFVHVSLMKLSAGDVDTQGDAVMNTDAARSTFQVNGALVRVGTLSDSYNSLGTAQADVLSGDLPSDPEILKDLALGLGTDEGRAMMQIIHDVAPGASLLFRSGGEGQADLAQGIIDLANANAQVIVDDISYFDLPFFQDGITAQAATQVVKQGIHYFSAAGNLNEHSYQAPFVDSMISAPVVGGTMHNFGGGDTYQSFTIDNTPGDNVITIVFQWNQPFKTVCGEACPGPTSNLDIYLRDQATTTIIAASQIDNVTAGVPIEAVQYVNNGIAPQVIELFIVHRSGPIPSLMKYIVPIGPGPDEYATYSSTSFGHANAERVIAVASTAFFNTPAFGVDPAVVNSSSSLGGTPIFFNSIDNSAYSAPILRRTPDVTGPDGGNNTFFGFDSVNDPDLFPNFFGTSAAAPHVAGLAALIIQNSVSQLSTSQMELILETTALDIADAGYDYKSGFGLVQADGPFGAVCGDIDGDSFCIDADECPSDPDKTEEGLCGCGVTEGTCDEEPVETIIVEEDNLVPFPVPVSPVLPVPPAFAPPITPISTVSVDPTAERSEKAPKLLDISLSYPDADEYSENIDAEIFDDGYDESEASSCSSVNSKDTTLWFFVVITLLCYFRRKTTLVS